MSKKKVKTIKGDGFSFHVDPRDEELFKDVVFIVNATHYEQHTFWRDYHYKPRPDTPVVKEWKHEGAGQGVCIGEFKKMPVCVTIFWSWLNGKKVAFIEATSAVTHHFMIEEWLKYLTLKTVRWDNGSRWAYADSWNFNHCLDAIGVLDEYREERKETKRKVQASKNS